MQVTARIHLSQAHHTGEGRPDGMVIQVRPGGVATGLGPIQGGAKGIHFGLGNGAALHQFLAALEIVQRALIFRFAARQLGAGIAIIQGDQHLTLIHLLPLTEVDLRHPTGDFGEDHHCLGGPRRPHRLHPIKQGTFDARRQIDHRRRTLPHGGRRWCEEPPQASTYQHHQYQGGDNPLHERLQTMICNKPKRKLSAQLCKQFVEGALK